MSAEPATPLHEAPVRNRRPASGRRRVRTLADADGLCNRKVLVVDRSDLVVAGFRTLLGRQGWVRACLAATSIPIALEYAQRFVPHVVLLDIAFVEETASECVRDLLDRAPDARVLLAASSGRLSTTTVQAAGACGWVAKDWGARELVDAVRFAANGVRHPPPPSRREADLSERERQVLALMASGATNREIGERLYLSPHTVKSHSSTLYRKLRVRNRAEAVVKAQRFGVIG